MVTAVAASPEQPVISIPVEEVGYDPKYYPRVNGTPDWVTVHRYVEALELSEPPPIVVVAATGYEFKYLLLDGLHRLRTFAKVGREEINAVVERIPKSRWLARSIELNIGHGRPMDSGDKAWVATRLDEEGWSRDKIASLLRMKVESLDRIVSTRCVRISAKAQKRIPEGRSNRKVNGNHYGFLKAALAETNGTARATTALLTQHSVTSHNVLGVLDSVISVLESGVVDTKSEDVAARVLRIKELIAAL